MMFILVSLISRSLLDMEKDFNVFVKLMNLLDEKRVSCPHNSYDGGVTSSSQDKY